MLNQRIAIDILHNGLFEEKVCRVSLLRLDRVHPVVSGNKLFKLHYFLEAAQKSPGRSIITFGGAYSNHLVATAFACREAGIRVIGIVRGEKPAQPSHTLVQCQAYGMELKYVSRTVYGQKETPGFINTLFQEYGEHILVPEGGYHPMGAAGAGFICDTIPVNNFTHIATAVGTATTMAGLLLGCGEEKTILGFPVLKGMNDVESRLQYLLGEARKGKKYLTVNEYAFNGYAKKDGLLIQFMNDFYRQTGIPTDFVYTGKMLFGIHEMIRKDYFKPGSNILCIHTGGLQGNDSLPPGTLIF